MPLYVYLSSIAVVAAVPLLWWGVAGTRVPQVHRRVREHLGVDEAVSATDLREVELRRSARERLIEPAISGFTRRARRLTPVGLVQALERRIVLAGVSAQWPIERVLAAKLILGTVGLVLGLLYLAANLSTGGFVVFLILVAIGYFIPDLILHSRASERQKQIEKSLADTLDQISISVEAGLGFEAALAQVGRSGSNPLNEEIIRTLQDIQIGVARVQALNGLLERTDVADLSHFVLAIKQAEEYGIPIAEVLRIQSTEMREKRRQRAEEQAMKVPVKIVFPLILCIMPALFIVVLGPAVLRIWDALIVGG